MLLNTSKQVEQAKQLISQFKTGQIKEMTDELWKSKKILDSTVHPDTGEAVLLPFRMSSCVLSNLIVTGGMLTPNLGTAGTLFWQVTNQSLNVAINISNANKSHPLSTTQLIKNYAIAVTASCGVALGLNSIVPRLTKVSANTKLILGRLVPFAAVVSAGVVNVFAMRSEEIKKGITVFDSDGEAVGTSKTAALYAVGETAASRVINATPIMVLPPLLLVRLQKTVLKGKGLGIQTLANIGIIAATSFAVLPFALAVFPQYQGISVESLEEGLRGKKDRNGNVIDKVYFNRGI
jgi:tricarboxylate carrier